MFKSTITLVLFLTTIISHAQCIKGHVQDQSDNPIAWATVSLYDLADDHFISGSLTDSLGIFKISEIDAKEIRLEISFLGFEKLEMTKILDGDLDLGILNLLASSQNLEEVTIIAKKPKITYKNGKLTYDVSHVKNATDSGMDLMENIPMVRLDKDENILVKNSSVKILINGKDLQLEGEELKSYLKSINASNFSKVEVITNPSAKYEAEGSGGIINIILKNKPIGQHTSLLLSNGYGRFHKLRAGISTSIAKEKWGASASIYPSKWKTFNFLTLDRTNKSDGTQLSQENEWIYNSNYLSGNLSFNYQIDEKTSLSSFYKNSHSNAEANSESFTRINQNENQSFEMDLEDNSNKKRSTLGTNIERLLDTSGTNLSLELMHINAIHQSNMNHFNTITNEMNTENFEMKSINDYLYHINTAKLNLSKTLMDKIEFETGIKLSKIKSESILDYELDQISKNRIDVNLEDNNFEYNEQIYAAFSEASGTFGNIELNLGLRLEKTMINTNISSSEENETNETHYLDLFPSMALSFSKNEINYSASYSRRLDRPYYEDLNPAINFIDQFSYSQGNVNLLPEYSNNLELSAQKDMTAISAYMNLKKGLSDEVIFQNDNNSVIFTTPFNLNKGKEMGLSFTTSYELGQLGEFDLELYGAFSQSELETTGLSTNVSNKFAGADMGYSKKLSENIDFGLTGYYSSGGQNGLYKRRPNYSVSSSLSMNFGKLNIALKVYDIFKTGIWDSQVDYANVNAHWVNRWENRRAYISLKYNFGKSETKNKGSYKKSTWSEEGGRL